VKARARSRALLFAAVGAGAVAIALGAYAGHALRPVELKTVDARFQLRGSTGTPGDVVMVLIDDVTRSELRIPGGPYKGNQVHWPYPHRYHARVIDRIAAAHPRALAVDVQFTEPTDVLGDNALIEAARAAGHPVFAAIAFTKGGRANIFGGAYPSFGVIAGNANVQDDPDHVLRRMLVEDQGATGFGVAAAERYLGRPVTRPTAGMPYIDYAGPPGTIRAYSFSDVYYGHVPPGAFRGKLVVVGPSAPSLQDQHLTSASGSVQMPGAEVQANAAYTALRGFPLRDVSRAWNVALVVLLGLVAPLAAIRLRGWRAPLLAVGVGALFAGAVQLAFTHGRVVVFTYPLLALGVSAVGVLGVEYVLEAFERARTRDAFSRFVPEAVVGQVLARTHGELRLGGERVHGTAMFTDLRGFTTFSEGLAAEEVIDLLNGYLSEISDAVLAHGGTLISYLGDGLMAVFGAPLPQDDHADRAVAAAREMLEERLPRYNESLRARGFDRGFKMGIGINTGEFMSGNVGSERRLEYTAIGDTVNTASRIEGMTKGTPYALFLADSTREALTRPVEDLVYVADLPVRGRSGTIELWSLSSKAVQKDGWRTEGEKIGVKGSGEPEEPLVLGRA